MGFKLNKGNPEWIAEGKRNVEKVREWIENRGEGNGMKLPEIAATLKLSEFQVRRALKIINNGD